MSYSYSSFGSLLSGAGMDALKAFQNNSKYMAGLKSVATDNTYTNTKKGFDSRSIFNMGTLGNTGSYTGTYNTNAGSLEKNFWSLIGSYMPSYSSSTSTSSSASGTSSKSSSTTSNNVLAAASANSVSDLIALLPKTGNFFNNDNSSSKMSSFLA